MSAFWIVGKKTGTLPDQWEFQGVFDSELKAVAACQTASYFVAPAILNEVIRDASEHWPGAYFPREQSH